MRSLAQKLSLLIHNHPAPVEFQASWGKPGGVHRYPGHSLDRVDNNFSQTYTHIRLMTRIHCLNKYADPAMIIAESPLEII